MNTWYSYGKYREVPVGSGFKEIMRFLYRTDFFTLGIIFLIVIIIITIFIIKSIIVQDIDTITTLLIILLIAILFAIISIPIYSIPILISSLIIWSLVKKGNKIFMDDKKIIINHQNWSMTPSLTNQIPLSLISHVQKADEDYWKERWKNTKRSWKWVRFHPLPPKGGLHPMYSVSKNLIIIFLKEPIKIRNSTLGARSIFGIKIKEYWVREVIIDINPEYQDEFIATIKGRK